MSGILEQIAADVSAIKAMLQNSAAISQQPAQPQTLAQPIQPQPVNQPGLGVLGAPAAAQPLAQAGSTGYPPATQEMIVELVTPLVADPNVKALLQAEMHAMGVQALPEAQPHQYPELYARFKRVEAQVQQQRAQQPQPAASPASII